MRERYAWRVWPEVSLASLKISASYLIGMHDFTAFGSPPRKGGVTVREIFQVNWKDELGYLIFDIVGNAFLYHMVRRLVSFQVEIGQGIRKPEDLINLLNGETESAVVGLAPANGLTLVEVIYPSETGG
jgi:tRNA pseudouridine38-40 synthase